MDPHSFIFLAVNENLIQAESLTPTSVSSPGELNNGDTCSSNGGESSSNNKESTSSSIYSLNEALRLTVTFTEEWLCVARMPLDFTKAEFDNLLSNYGPVSQSFLIHSETSGKWKTKVARACSKSLSAIPSVLGLYFIQVFRPP